MPSRRNIESERFDQRMGKYSEDMKDWQEGFRKGELPIGSTPIRPIEPFNYESPAALPRDKTFVCGETLGR